MSTGRWRVEFRRSTHNVTAWHVFDASGQFAGELRSLPEAHSWAMRQSRMITVKLPRVGDKVAIFEGEYVTLISHQINGNVWLDSGGVQFNILPGELEDTALTLLAMHHRGQGKQ